MTSQPNYSAPIQPSYDRPDGRIVVLPEGIVVEVRRFAVVVAHESWGTRAATYEVIAHSPALHDLTVASIESATARAASLAETACDAVRKDNPDYMTPPRY